MAIIVVGFGPDMALAQRQSRLRALQRLTLAFLVAAEHHCTIRRMEIQSHDVPELLLKMKILGKL